MKKLIAAALTGALVLGTVGTSVVFAADDDKTITVAASETPHSEILEAAKPILEEEGYDFEPISRKNLQKAYERYAADPIGYIALTSPQVKVTVTDDNGKPYQPKNMPYNPIEREER